jgi:DNA-binding transcriptional MerR regulator
VGEFTLKELADAAGEKERTVRYYQQLGLLRQPGQIGAGAHYDEDDRLRLLLIRRLQRDGRTLTEIAAHFATLDAGGLREEALRYGSALDYVRSVLGDSTPVAVVNSSQAVPAPAAPPTAQWERIEVVPGIELHVKHPITSIRRKRIAAYIELARREIEGES